MEDQHLLKEVKTRKENIVMLWINHKKKKNAYDMMWIIECEKMFKISDKVVNFIMRAMES